jgi:ArsR family transcriptional regulator
MNVYREHSPEQCSLDIREPERRRLTTMFKALGNPFRFRIVQYMAAHPGCITSDIIRALPIAQATVSQHLKVLRDAGWVSGESEGAAIRYWLSLDDFRWFHTTVGRIF